MLMVYGAAGYTARLILRELDRRGIAAIAAGRSGPALRDVRGPVRVFDLARPAEVAAALDGVTAVVNATGRYATTALPLVEACLTRKAHYLDLAGEIPEHLRLLGVAERAAAAGVAVMPGIGFGVVPTELAAVEAVRRLGVAPDRLQIAYAVTGGASRGTLDTVLRALHTSGWQRRAGALVATRPGARHVRLRFGDDRPVHVLTNPWRADVVSAFASLACPDIETLASFPALARLLIAWPRFTGSRLGQWLIARAIAAAPPGPSAAARAAGTSKVRVDAVAGCRQVTVVLRGPEAYDFTARVAALVVARVVAGQVAPGFATPSRVLDWPALVALDGVAEVSP